jgi:hypothetical protein
MAASTLDEPARQARFIFVGTIVQLNASTEATIPVTESTAVVRVDEVIQAPAALGEQTDREITVRLRAAQAAEQGEQAVFFTDPWLYGEGLAVVEVDRREAAERKGLRERLSKNDAVKGDEALKRRLEMAVLVVVGMVTNTRPLMPGQPGIVTEHDPEWWEAVVAVRSVEKGTSAGPTVGVLFAASADVMWFQAPKLRVRQDGVLLLHQESTPKLAAASYAVLDPLDVLPLEQIERVRRLLGGGATRPSTST